LGTCPSETQLHTSILNIESGQIPNLSDFILDDASKNESKPHHAQLSSYMTGLGC